MEYAHFYRKNFELQNYVQQNFLIDNSICFSRAVLDEASLYLDAKNSTNNFIYKKECDKNLYVKFVAQVGRLNCKQNAALANWKFKMQI